MNLETEFCYITEHSGFKEIKNCYINTENYNLLPSKEIAEKFLILQILYTCRQAYIGDWKPDWTDANFKYCIKSIGKKIERVSEMNITCILAFPTKEMRDAFFENFKSLIEQCKEFL